SEDALPGSLPPGEAIVGPALAAACSDRGTLNPVDAGRSRRRQRTTGMKKQDVIDLVQRMPEEIDIERLIYHLYVIRKIELAEASMASGDLLTEEEVDREIESWFAHDGRDARSETLTISDAG